jgi:hypothetical protein
MSGNALLAPRVDRRCRAVLLDLPSKQLPEELLRPGAVRAADLKMYHWSSHISSLRLRPQRQCGDERHSRATRIQAYRSNALHPISSGSPLCLPKKYIANQGEMNTVPGQV